MKKCTYCGREYPDDAVACAIDAQPLEGGPKPIPTSAPISSGQPAAPPVVPATAYSFPCPNCGSVASIGGKRAFFIGASIGGLVGFIASGFKGGFKNGFLGAWVCAPIFGLFGSGLSGYRCSKCGKIPFDKLPPKAQTHFVGVWVISLLIIIIAVIFIVSVPGIL